MKDCGLILSILTIDLREDDEIYWDFDNKGF